MGKTIQVRKIDTLKEISKLQRKYGLSTATSAIDLAVGRHSSMEKQIHSLWDELHKTKDQLQRIKTAVEQKLQADKNFQLFFEKG